MDAGNQIRVLVKAIHILTTKLPHQPHKDYVGALLVFLKRGGGRKLSTQLTKSGGDKQPRNESECNPGYSCSRVGVRLVRGQGPRITQVGMHTALRSKGSLGTQPTCLQKGSQTHRRKTNFCRAQKFLP